METKEYRIWSHTWEFIKKDKNISVSLAEKKKRRGDIDINLFVAGKFYCVIVESARKLNSR